jgi:hypothetical protein
MFEHRYEEMRSHVMRLTKNLSKNVEKWRTSSYANLFNADVLTNNDKLQQMISDAIRHELEEKIYAPLMHDLVYFLQKKVHAKEKQFMERVLILKGKPQSYFGIPIEKISLSSWRTVVDAIKEMDGAFLPLDKLRKLVAAAHQIHSLYHKERELLRGEEDHVAEGDDAEKECNTVLEQHDVGGNSNHEDRRSGSSARSRSRSKASSGDYEDVLSGDDFLPIFIYVIVHSELEFPIMTQVLLNRLCDPEKRRSESGYYLATFEAALHHILYVTEDNENSSIIK